MRTIFASLCLSSPALADFYADPNSVGGNGSIGSPWNLNIALTNSAALNGQTLLLRNGNYHGHFKSNLTNAVVKSHPGEWAVLDDANAAVVGLAANSTTNKLAVANSEWFQSSQVLVLSTGEHVQLSSVSQGTNWTVTRGWNGTTAMSVPANTTGVLKEHIINHTGSGTKFFDFEITSVLSTNRQVGSNWWVGGALNLDVGFGNKAINLVIHNVGHPAIGFWDQGDGGEISGCIMWGNGMYDREGGWIRGTSVYAQNSTGNVYLKNNIVFRNFTEGMQAYGTAASTKGFRFINNITMMNPNGYGIAVWNAEVPMSDNACWTNYHGLDGQIWGYTSLSNTTMSCLGNVFVKPPNSTIVKNHTSGDFKWNTFLFDGYGSNNGMFSLQYPEYALSNMSLSIDRNIYYYTNHATDLFGLTTLDHPAGGGKLTFPQWQAQSGYDSNSTFTATLPTNYQNVGVFQNDYDANRFHIAIVSTTGATNYALNLGTSCGFVSGNTYRLIDAQNWPVVVSQGTYTGGTINVPLNLTNIARLNGSITNFTDQHSNLVLSNTFNAFIVQNIPNATLQTGTLTIRR